MLLRSTLPTPVQPMDRLGAAIGLAPGRLWVKRDDLTGLAGGGNKVRKLELLCAEAMDRGCDTLVTGGGRQSNHARLTAAAAAVLGLRCRLVLGSDPPATATGNLVLDHLLGAEIVWAGPLDYYALEAAISDEADRVAADGGRPYAMPLGGASIVGQQGYVAAALELRAQLPGTSLIVVADGTGGTHAGLVAGWGSHDAVLGIDVGTRPDLDDTVPRHALEAAASAHLPNPGGACQIDHERYAPGYGEPNPGAREALDLAARLEGLILDPVYSGKAMAGLLAAAREDRLPPAGTIVFLHTGGMPALFSPRYSSWIEQRP